MATRWALTSIDSVSLTSVRFFLAFLIGGIFFFLIGKRQALDIETAKLSAIPGLLIGLMLVSQTWGLEYTTITNSGFITTLYVVFVPIVQYILFRTKPKLLTYVWIMTAVLGTGLMVQIKELSMNIGDGLTLVCAFLGACQIVWVEKVRNKITSPFAFNIYQSGWAAIISLFCIPIYGVDKTYFFDPDLKAIIGFVSVTIGSTLIAFALQIKAQKSLNATTASLFFLLESPFATMFAILLLNEPITPNQILGATLILIAAIGSTR